MSNITITPNMNLPTPVPSECPGPDWANDIVADMYAIDSHDHTSGKGVQITPDGLDISADLPMGSNNLTEVRSVNFTAQLAPIALSTDLGCIYVSGADLYYNDEAGNQVRITQGGAVTGATGTITGLPSGTASASYSAGTFTFQSATNTPANMAVGPLTIGRNSASPKTVSITPSVSQASNYDITLPISLPASTSFLTIDSSGNMGSVTSVATIASGSFSPTVTFTLLSGPGLSISQGTSSWYYNRIGNIAFVTGSTAFTSSGFSSSSSYSCTATIPVATASLAAAGLYNGRASSLVTTHIESSSNTGVVTESGVTALSFTGNASGIVVFSYSYIIS